MFLNSKIKVGRMEIHLNNIEYKNWLVSLKSKIRQSQLKASLMVNVSLISFYWDLGKMISEKEKVWGSKLIFNLSKDLQSEFPDVKGFSERNLKYCRKFYEFYNGKIGQQVVAQIPWGHNILIFTKSRDILEAQFYIQKTISNQWSRNTLSLQIETDLYRREGRAVNNFSKNLLEPFSDLATQVLKDPYVFEFITLDEEYREKDIENQLINSIQKFLLELGKGFAFVGKQYHLSISENDYYLDLLFYHIHLKCYVVIELKNTKFIPEFAGKMNFYLSSVDDLVKRNDDNPTIGILICKSKNNIEAEFALRGMNKPIGISEFKLVSSLPENLKSNLPTIKEIEDELRNL